MESNISTKIFVSHSLPLVLFLYVGEINHFTESFAPHGVTVITYQLDGNRQ